MTKLKNKIFKTILLILTSFLITLLIIFNYQDYKREKDNINNNLNRLNNRIDKLNMPKPPQDKERPNEPNNFTNHIFMDIVVYTVILDNNNNIIDIYSHNENNINTNTINKKAKQILNNNIKDRTFIGNLYTNR